MILTFRDDSRGNQILFEFAGFCSQRKKVRGGGRESGVFFRIAGSSSGPLYDFSSPCIYKLITGFHFPLNSNDYSQINDIPALEPVVSDVVRES